MPDKKSDSESGGCLLIIIAIVVTWLFLDGKMNDLNSRLDKMNYRVDRIIQLLENEHKQDSTSHP